VSLLPTIKNALYELILRSSTTVCRDTVDKLEEFLESEQNNPVTKTTLELMLENIRFGHRHQIPLCQDTGHINIFIQIGDNFPIISNFKEMALEILQKLTNESILRPNTVDPISQINEGCNGGINQPPIYIEIISESTELVISVMNKGGGSENMSSLFMLPAATGYHELIPKIIDHMKFTGGKPCPPTIVGVGLGGDASKCMFLAKKALLRPLGSRNQREDVARLENTLLTKLNELDIGVMGLGGHSNCLDVRMELAMRHPATYPVGIIVECYCHRTESCCISSSGLVTFGHLDRDFKFEEVK
jgi:fumarate hydratase subunit alpha